MPVLVDTSVWVAHFKKKNDCLVSLLHAEDVLSHSLIISEIACGTPPQPRKATLKNLDSLTKSNQAEFKEVLTFIENNKLYGLGCGFIDIALLASVLITPSTELWTMDKRLKKLSDRFGVTFKTR